MDTLLDMHKCMLCPRECGADRVNKLTGFCGCQSEMSVSRAALHFWEEPVISGTKGSGTIFFNGCNLRCVYCQNREISRSQTGKLIDSERLVEIFYELQEKGAANINLVTPGHYLHKIIPALEMAKKQRFDLPIIYNTGSYEKVEVLKRLEGLVDVYLPDLKYLDHNLAKKYSQAENYPEIAKQAIAEMYRQVGKNVFVNNRENVNKLITSENFEANSYKEFDITPGQEITVNTVMDDYEEDVYISKGVIVRHLVLPGCLEDSKSVIRYLYETYGDDIYLSIMSQYTPLKAFVEEGKYPELSQKLSMEEYEKLVDYAIDLGVENAFVQEEEVSEESFIPKFDCEGV